MTRTCRLAILLLVSCSGSGSGPRSLPGTPVDVTLAPEQQQEVQRLQALRADASRMTADELLARRAVPFRAELGYDPRTAVNMDLVQRSMLRLGPAALAALGQRGFVIDDSRRFPHFAYGYETIYAQDLPVFVSADSILQAVHQSYDDILKALEREALIPEVRALLTGMRARLPALAGDATARKDADLFLAVGLSLLEAKPQTPVAGASASDVARLVSGATRAEGSAGLTLFGLNREVDLSQFKPRGHYAGDPQLEAYFRAMMWLGRIDLPFLHTDEHTGKPTLVRSCVAAAVALRALMDDEATAHWKRVDATLRAFVGEPDSMGPLEIDQLERDLAVTNHDLTPVSDEALARAIVAGGYGKQRILSQIVIQDPHAGAWPLDATFLFMGQRYVFDSHVFSNVVYDRVEKRLMPDPLDVAYAALGNDQAAKLLEPELRKYPYAGALEATRKLGEEHGTAFWEGNLYNLWLTSLRALSPGAEVADRAAGLPAVAATEAWGRRILNTQLASWAELRHDTILYAKQSYTTGVACQFPDAYVEPYPAFFAALEKLAARGAAVAADLPASLQVVSLARSYFAKMGGVATRLRRMAEHQRSGMPHDAEDIAFINQAVRLQRVCGSPGIIQGWYADLFFSPSAGFDPTIADVHTKPADANGPAHVLHVGTGWARLMVMTVDTCMGPRAYAGVVSSYHELTTNDLTRLDDNAWAAKFTPTSAPEDVPWMRDLITH